MHCHPNATLPHFNQAAELMAQHLPRAVTVHFRRWHRGRLHNRYILTNLGGIKTGDVIEDGGEDEYDAFNIMARDVYEFCWNHIVKGEGYEAYDSPASITGTQ